jgi:hypothetical protein
VDETLTAGKRRELFHLFRTGTTRGSVTLRKGRSFKAFGPKVISCTELPNDAALNSRCVLISIQQTHRINLAKPTDQAMLDIADVLQKQLLRFRLENFHSLCLPKVEGDESLHARTRDLYQALLLPVGTDPDACKYLVHLFKRQQEISRESLSPACAVVVRVLYEHIHLHSADAKCAQSELTLKINFNLEHLQDTVRLTAHEVGRTLSSLGLNNRKRTNLGYILWLDLQTRKRIHQLANDHGIDQESQFLVEGFRNDCELCKSPAPTSIEKKGDRGTDTKRT